MTSVSHQADTQPEQTAGRLVADSLTAGFSILVVFTVGQRLVGFLRQLLICKLMDPEQLGRWNLAYSMILLAAPLIVFGIPGTFGRYTEHFRQQGQLRGYLRKTVLMSIAMTLLGGLLISCLARPVAWLMFEDTRQVPMVITLALALVAVTWFNFVIELLTSLRQVKATTWLRFGCSMLFISLSIGLLVFRQPQAEMVVIGYGIACLITGAIGSAILYRGLRSVRADASPTTRESIWRKLLPFAGWIWLADLLSNLFFAADRYMIVHFGEFTSDTAVAMVGQYHSSRIIPDQMIAMAALIGGILLPYLSHDWERGDRETVVNRLNLTLKLYTLLMTAVGIGLMLCAPWLFDIVLEGKYGAGLSVTPWSIVACLWFGLYCLAINFLYCCERAGYCSVCLAVGLVANIGLNYLLLPVWGLQGAVMATAIANAFATIMVYYYAHRFGMEWTRGTWVVGALPLALVYDARLGLALFLILLLLDRFHTVLLTAEEKQFLRRRIQHFIASHFRLGRLQRAS